MDEPREDKGQEKGDDILRRMLKTPPKPHEPEIKKPMKEEWQRPATKPASKS